MRIDLCGRNALVTGGAHGIGQAIARALAACGARVWIGDVELPPPGAAGTYVAMDVRRPETVEAAVEAAEPVEIVVANAGTALPAPLTETSPHLWERTVQVNLTGAFLTVRAAARAMKARRRGSIVVTASTNSFDGEPDLVAYNATKAGLLGLVRTAAGELGPWGIRVNALCPGLIRTRLTADHFESPVILEEYFRQIPLGRGGEPEEVAAAAAFLASDLASFITGATLLIDGGQMATKYGPWNESMGEFGGDRWRLKQ
jgi:NAD(P)-dependent dehydrogenase (short-subunit alcohol dehydrogenase family)